MNPIKHFRTSLFGAFWVALALHFFNVSIDAKDQYPDYVQEDLSFNDIESVTEFFAEVVLGMKNTFYEREERDIDDPGLIDINKFYFPNAFSFFNLNTNLRNKIDFYIRNSVSPSSLSSEIISPPPRA